MARFGMFKNTLPTRYYYLLFGIQNFREALESVKQVMTKEKMDNKLAGQSSTPCMPFKIYPSTENKIVKFDECKLLYYQIDRLREVQDRMTTKPQGR